MQSRDPEFDGMEWTFQIIARAQSKDGIFYVGLKLAPYPHNQTAQIFTEDGFSPDLSDYAMGFRLTNKSRRKPQWEIKD